MADVLHLRPARPGQSPQRIQETHALAGTASRTAEWRGFRRQKKQVQGLDFRARQVVILAQGLT